MERRDSNNETHNRPQQQKQFFVSPQIPPQVSAPTSTAAAAQQAPDESNLKLESLIDHDIGNAFVSCVNFINYNGSSSSSSSSTNSSSSCGAFSAKEELIN